jgi:hypothetical protein
LIEYSQSEDMLKPGLMLVFSFYWSPEDGYDESRYNSIVGEITELLSACKFGE